MYLCYHAFSTEDRPAGKTLVRRAFPTTYEGWDNVLADMGQTYNAHLVLYTAGSFFGGIGR